MARNIDKKIMLRLSILNIVQYNVALSIDTKIVLRQ